MGWVLFLLVAIILGPGLLFYGVWKLFFRKAQGEEPPGIEDAEAPPVQPQGDERPKRGLAILATVIGGSVTAFLSLVFGFLFSLDFTKGRLLRVDGQTQRSRRALGNSWTLDLPSVDLSPLNWVERAALGELWLRSAQLEQASVPAFSKLSLKLTALGAPASLVERAHYAALDEIDHARRFFALSRAFSGLPWTAGEIPALKSPRTPKSSQSEEGCLVQLAVGSFTDGYIAEGIAARVAEKGADSAVDSVLSATLVKVAQDEAVHAELAWDIMLWCVDKGGKAVQQALMAAADEIQVREGVDDPRLPALRPEVIACWGVPSADIRGSLAGAWIEEAQTRVISTFS